MTDTINVAIAAFLGVMNSHPSNQTNHKPIAEKIWPAKNTSQTGFPKRDVNPYKTHEGKGGCL